MRKLSSVVKLKQLTRNVGLKQKHTSDPLSESDNKLRRRQHFTVNGFKERI